MVYETNDETGRHWWTTPICSAGLNRLPLLPEQTSIGDRRPGRSRREVAARSSSRRWRWRSYRSPPAVVPIFAAPLPRPATAPASRSQRRALSPVIVSRYVPEGSFQVPRVSPGPLLGPSLDPPIPSSSPEIIRNIYFYLFFILTFISLLFMFLSIVHLYFYLFSIYIFIYISFLFSIFSAPSLSGHYWKSLFQFPIEKASFS